MAFIFDSEFITISILVLKKITGKLQFDIYLKRAENKYTKLFKVGDIVSQSRLERYWINKNISELSVSKDEYRQYLLYVEQVADKYVEDTSSIEANEVVHITREIIDLTMLEIFVDMNVDQSALIHASQAVKGCVDVLARDPGSIVKIFKHITKHPYLLKHSIATAMFSLMLAKIEKNENENTYQKLGLGALMHDIGMSRLSFDPEDKDSLTPSEWKEIKEHPHVGKRIIDCVPAVPSESKIIIMQHHEQPNGVGYPNQLHDKDIFYLAKIVSIADSFSALTSKRPYQSSTPPVKALELMKLDHGAFDKALLKSFIGIFVQVE
jgi:HD-GYP domain-containing protein (c-di-GMP phosphodiesterase class II)